MSAIAPYITCSQTTRAPLISCGMLLDTFGQPRPEFKVLEIQNKTQNQSAEVNVTTFSGLIKALVEVVVTSGVLTNYMSTPTVTTDLLINGTILSKTAFLSKYIDLFTPSLGSTATKLVGSFLAANMNQTSVSLTVGKSITQCLALKYLYTGSTNSLTLTLGNSSTHAPVITTTATTFSSSASLRIQTRTITPGAVSTVYTIAPTSGTPKPIVSTNVPFSGSTRYEGVFNISNVTFNIGAPTNVATCYLQVGTGSSAFPFTGGAFIVPYRSNGAVHEVNDPFAPLMVDYMVAGDTLTSTVKLCRHRLADASTTSIWVVQATSSISDRMTTNTVGYFTSNNVNESPSWIRIAMTDSGGLNWFLTGRLQIVSY